MMWGNCYFQENPWRDQGWSRSTSNQVLRQKQWFLDERVIYEIVLLIRSSNELAKLSDRESKNRKTRYTNLIHFSWFVLSRNPYSRNKYNMYLKKKTWTTLQCLDLFFMSPFLKKSCTSSFQWIHIDVNTIFFILVRRYNLQKNRIGSPISRRSDSKNLIEFDNSEWQLWRVRYRLT